MEGSCSKRHREELIRLVQDARREFNPERDNADINLRRNITLIDLLENSNYGRNDGTSAFHIFEGEETFEKMSLHVYPLDEYTSAIWAGAEGLLGPYGDVRINKSVNNKEVIVRLSFKRVDRKEDSYPWFL